MAFTVSCPECEAVLKPVKPLTPGQKVKCPKCGVGFAYKSTTAAAPPAKTKPKAAPSSRRDQQTSVLPNADEVDEDSTPGKTKSAPKSTVKRPEVKTTELPQAKKKPVDDEDDGEGTYTLQGSLQEEEDDDKPVIQYIPDAGIKDLRGPANALLVGPSNLLIVAGGLGFLGWLVLLLLMLWPAIFPEPEDPRLKDKQQQNFRMIEEDDGKKKDEDINPFKIGDFDLMVVSTYSVGMILLCCLPMAFGMLYSGLVAAGAVKMQNLESRPWSIAAAVMVILPFNFGGFLTVSAFFLNFALGMLFDEGEKGMPMTIALVLLWLSNVGLGARILYLLFQDTVIDGFEYVPEG